MLPIDFEGSNKTFTAPENMTDEQCNAIKAFVGKDDAGFPFVLTAWQPSKADIESIIAGGPILLKIVGNGMPPVDLFTINENSERN